jgi:uncharacterized iron-regulated membrane protein
VRVTYTVDPHSGEVTGKDRVADKNIVDRAVNVGIAAHEGQLFGRINQAILLVTAMSLVLMSISATVMWWRRRPAHTLGAPQPAAPPRFSTLLPITILTLSVLLPLFGLSLIVIIAVDQLLLPRLPATERWLGLAQRAE